MREYLRRWQATIVDYILYQPIYKICIGVESMEVSSWFLQWWYQDHVPAQVER